MQKVHCYFIKKLQLIVSIEFQSLFHVLKHSFTFPLQYLFTIGYLNIFRFEDGSPFFKENNTCFLLLVGYILLRHYRTFTPFG